MVIFIDGLNDFYNASGEPQFTARLRELMTSEVGFMDALKQLVEALPLVRWLSEQLNRATA